MIVSWNWLKDYVKLDMPPAELEHRLAMSGLNHEATEAIDDDLAIDLEVTSNRPDCLGHLGVAREISVLWDLDFTVPNPTPQESEVSVHSACQVSIECSDLCHRYTARVIRGVNVGPSPTWLANRLHTLGIAVINNVVDSTNYVMMECGQPLHAFDFAKIRGGQIVVRDARPSEPFRAIDHRTYELHPGMCVIGDESRPVALGGVMGGADTEVSDETTDLLIEAAEFAPLSIRGTARALRLHSPSSYRFERGIDPEGVDWASRRVCELILDSAGGRLLSGVVDVVAGPPADRAPIVFRYSQLKRILGIELEASEIRQILNKLGVRTAIRDDRQATFVAPSWRRDLTREIDLIEEVARIHGYEEISEDVGVPMVASHRSDDDRVLSIIRQVLLCAGFCEAMTPSVVDSKLSTMFSPWSSAEPIRCSTPLLRGADRLRRSIVPSLLSARRTNESLANPRIELFETAKVYLPSQDRLPREEAVLAITSGAGFETAKGVVEAIVGTLGIRESLDVAPSTDDALLDPRNSCQLSVHGELLGFLGVIRSNRMKELGLRGEATIAEIKLTPLRVWANLVPQYRPLSTLPAISLDLNLVVDETVRWSDLVSTVGQSAGEVLEAVHYRETYRDPEKDGAGKKRLLFAIVLRSDKETLTSEQADSIRGRIVAACSKCHGATLLE